METTLFQDPAFWLLTLFLIPLLLRVPIALSLGFAALVVVWNCLLYTSPSPRDA